MHASPYTFYCCPFTRASIGARRCTFTCWLSILQIWAVSSVQTTSRLATSCLHVALVAHPSKTLNRTDESGSGTDRRTQGRPQIPHRQPFPLLQLIGGTGDAAYAGKATDSTLTVHFNFAGRSNLSGTVKAQTIT